MDKQFKDPDGRSQPSALIAEAEGVRDLTGHPAWAFLMDLIEGRVRILEEQVYAEGEPLSQAEYARLTGEIVGLRSLAGAVETMLSKAEKAERELENAVKLAAVGS